MAESNFVDYVKIYCRSGKGGRGSTHMRREKYCPNGGPDGGDGGRGGHIILRGNRNYWTLLHLKYDRHAMAGHGESGSKNRSFGKDGADKIIEVPCGTVVYNAETGEYLCDVTEAIDIDEWCVRNSIENIELNHVDDIAVSEGDASSLVGKGPFDVIIANINRNILLNDMKQYVACMHTNSELYMSGFYIDDIAAIREEAEKNGLTFVHYKEKNRWAEVKFIYKG